MQNSRQVADSSIAFTGLRVCGCETAPLPPFFVALVRMTLVAITLKMELESKCAQIIRCSRSLPAISFPYESGSDRHMDRVYGGCH
jgi:hypothetical protein